MDPSEWSTKPKRVIEDGEDHDQKCSTASQPIQYFKMVFSATGVVDSDGNISSVRSLHSRVSAALPCVLTVSG